MTEMQIRAAAASYRNATQTSSCIITPRYGRLGTLVIVQSGDTVSNRELQECLRNNIVVPSSFMIYETCIGSPLHAP